MVYNGIDLERVVGEIPFKSIFSERYEYETVDGGIWFSKRRKRKVVVDLEKVKGSENFRENYVSFDFGGESYNVILTEGLPVFNNEMITSKMNRVNYLRIYNGAGVKNVRKNIVKGVRELRRD